MSESIDRIAIRKAIKTVIDECDEITKAELINEIAADQEAPAQAVRTVVEEYLRTGEIYAVGEGDNAEVRRT